MANVTYDDRSFLIDDQRIWIVSGSLHYFRVPAEHWPDRLLKLKRAGLNCVSTPIMWNFHEPAEGEWDFEGDRDIVEFVREAARLGLYVILRPGPFFGGEWDFGGLPGWLVGKSGISFRTNNAAYSHYLDKYFAQVLPRLAEHQVTHDGNILLIQNENEYLPTTLPDRSAYLDFITQLFRRSGFTIPITSANHFSDPPAEGTIETVNADRGVLPALRMLHLRQSHAPMLASEFHFGRADAWGGEHRSVPPKEIARRAMEILGCGSQWNYYMFCGGTNFDFWAGRLPDAIDAFTTTSYDYDAPVGEGGGLTPTYYATRPANLLASSMAVYFADTHMEEPGVGIDDASEVMNLFGSMGRWAVVTNHGREDIRRVTVSLPTGRTLEVDLGPAGAAVVPYELKLPGERVLDFATLTPLGLFGKEEQAVLIFHGPAGLAAEISINGHILDVTIPDDGEPKLLEHQGLRVVLVDSELATRTWPMEEAVFFGPEFIGEDVESIRFAPKAKAYHVLSLEDGKLSTKKVKNNNSPSKPTTPRLSAWKRICICPEPVKDDVDWHKLDRPRDVDKLGIHYGYAWYRIDVDAPRARKHKLLPTECADRASLYVNGALAGVWGDGDGAVREPIPVSFKRGRNVLALLVDNLGRFHNGDRLGEPKGLFGHIWDAKPLRTNKFKISETENFPKRIVPRTLAHLTGELEKLPLQAAEVSVPLTKLQSIYMFFRDIPHHLAVFCNDRPVGFFARHAGGMNWGEVTLGAEMKKGKNQLRILLWGEVDPAVLENFRFFSLQEPISAGANWMWKPWTLPDGSASEPIKSKPCWYRATFKSNPGDTPLFLTVAGAKKGQLFLNGRNVGRFWTVGPQERYYLPGCWLQEENELLLFEENGNMPSRCKLEYRTDGPYR
jgi:hypothetical protein